MEENSVKGLVLFAPEGVNGTVAGTEEGIVLFKQKIRDLSNCQELTFKDSTSEVRPFHRITVDIRKEIVGLKRPDLVPDSAENFHLTPTEWHQAMLSEEPKVIIDTRNRYETMAGKFKGAIDPGINNFSEWGQYLDSAEIPQDVPVYMYCTGGIRCEKAILEMRSRGFDKVYQLRDGILGYLAEYPNGEFEGDCFVFDDRVALDQNLKPSGRLGICPGCGLPTEAKNVCDRCDKTHYMCEACLSKWGPVCSKQCLDLYRRHGPRNKA